MFASSPSARHHGHETGRGFPAAGTAGSPGPRKAGRTPYRRLPEEIETPAPAGSAVITIAGNRCCPLPTARDLRGAGQAGLHGVHGPLPQRDHAARRRDLPPPPPSRSAHFDVAFRPRVPQQRPLLPPAAVADGRPDEWRSCRGWRLRAGLGPDADPALIDDEVIAAKLGREVADPNSPVAGRFSRRIDRDAARWSRLRAATGHAAATRPVR